MEVKMKSKNVCKGKGKSRRYSDAFKRKVVSDLQTHASSLLAPVKKQV